MIRIITLFCLLAATFSIDAQRYSYSASEGVYEELVNADTVYYEEWHEFEAPITLPFDFNFYGKDWDRISFGQGLLSFEDSNRGDTIGIISGWFADLVSSEVGFEESPILTQTTGIVGERIFKIEWRQAYFWYLEGFFDYVNFQIWLYEDDRKIEVHYGSSITDLAAFEYDKQMEIFGGNVGVGIGEDDAINATFLGGDVDDVVTVDTFELLRGFPIDGTIYIFEEINTSTIDLISNIDIYPSLAVQNIYITTPQNYAAIPFQVVDLDGRMVDTGILNSEMTIVNVQNYNSGLYFILNNEGQSIGRFIKQ